MTKGIEWITISALRYITYDLYKDMFYVYVLKSNDCKRIYIGFSSNIEKRLAEHNSGKTKSTKPYSPWHLIYVESFELKVDALKRERQMKKSGTIRRQLKEGVYIKPIPAKPDQAPPGV